MKKYDQWCREYETKCVRSFQTEQLEIPLKLEMVLDASVADK